MTTIMKDWTAPISEYDFKTLQRLSGKIDLLLKEYYTDQLSIDKYTNNRNEVWDGIDHADTGSLFKEEEQAESYAKKQQLFDTRYRRDNAYRKLKLAMDYWCALWFWEYDDANNLPTRQEYWADIEALLDVDNDKLDRRTRQALERVGSDVVAEDMPEYGTRMTEEESEIVTKTQEELLTESHGSLTLFAEDEPLRLKIADRLAKRYRFFHPMLEFIEVFWLRDGFDIICGNPPFLKWFFEPQLTLSDYYPELVIRPDVYDADYVESHIQDYLTHERIINLYKSEQTETECCKAFINSASLYGELKGGQSDLFKCILLNSSFMLSPNGYMGLIHPDTPFTEAKGQAFRHFLYPRLVARYQYSNRLELFNDVHNEKPFDCCIYSGMDREIKFDSISNLVHPSTVDACYAHDGSGFSLGLEYVDEEGKKHLNTAGHRDRIVRYDENLLKLVAEVFEGTVNWETCKLVTMQSQRNLDIIKRFVDFKHVSSVNPFVTVAFDATNAKKDGSIKACTKYPDYEKYEMIFNSTQIGILSPFYKLPREVCVNDSQYDVADYTLLSPDYEIRTNLVPGSITIASFKSYIDDSGKWFEKYKVGFKKKLDVTHERTLKGGILPPKSAHTHSIISVSFDDIEDTIQFAGLCSSIVFDYFVKTVGVGNLTSSVITGFPFGVRNEFVTPIKARVLRLNCVNHWYESLWKDSFDTDMLSETWSKKDPRLSPFNMLNNQLNNESLLRNDFARRQALVELDVLVAMAMGLNLDDLLFIYENTFTTTQKYDADTWYDANGRVVFSVSTNYQLKLDRKGNRKYGILGWEDIRGEEIVDDNGKVMGYKGTALTHTHTIDPRKSELYGGQQQTFIAPYNRCDRIADYRTAWAHFEKIFNK